MGTRLGLELWMGTKLGLDGSPIGTTLGLELCDSDVELSGSGGGDNDDDDDGGDDGSGTTVLMVGVSTDGRSDEGPGASSCLLCETASGMDDLLDRGSSEASHSSGGDREASMLDENSHRSPMDRNVPLSSATCSVASDGVAVRGREPCETKEASLISSYSSSVSSSPAKS